MAVLIEGGLWVYWMTMTVSQLYFWIMMTVISIEKVMRLPSVNVFLRENADCYVDMAFRSHSKLQSYFYAKLNHYSISGLRNIFGLASFTGMQRDGSLFITTKVSVQLY